MNKELSGAAGDVLYALFFRGALVDGDLPSKAGAAELRELGYMMTQDTVTPFAGEHHFNFLTPIGQEFAISYFVHSKFGKRLEDIQQKEVVFMGERFALSIDAANLAEAMRGVLSRHESAMADLAFARAAITENLNQAVNDAIANALRPGGVLYAFRART
ncbi:TPA: hypothetical protein I8287_003458 [Kluyvera intermedia]|nr:hypothetical protein [Kluyvera intermedia]